MASTQTLERRTQAVAILSGNGHTDVAQMTEAYLAMGENLLRMLTKIEKEADKTLQALWNAERNEANEEIARSASLLRQASDELMSQIMTNGQGVRF